MTKKVKEKQYGVLTDDTFQRIFAIIKPEQLEKCFRNWVKSVFETEENEIISLDGKTICGSRMDDYSFIHIVSAWANQAGIVLGQIRVDDKSNEITAVPKLLDLIEVENCVFTSDAIICIKIGSFPVFKMCVRHGKQPFLQKNHMVLLFPVLSQIILLYSSSFPPCFFVSSIIAYFFISVIYIFVL